LPFPAHSGFSAIAPLDSKRDTTKTDNNLYMYFSYQFNKHNYN
jgi:hypothetical protein